MLATNFQLTSSARCRTLPQVAQCETSHGPWRIASMEHLVNNIVSVRYPKQLAIAKAHVNELAASRKEIGMPERPGELIYALDETPPWPHLLALGFAAERPSKKGNGGGAELCQ